MKKLLSLLVVSLLLCAGVIGFLFTGASAEGTYYYVRSKANSKEDVYASVDDALEAAEQKNWDEKDSLIILIDDANYTTETLSVDEYGILFGQKTIWRGEGINKSKLPITIDVKSGNSFAFSVSSGISMACANDYTFRNLTLPIGDASSSTKFYAGSGEVTFEFVDFGTKYQGVFLGDNFTKAAYIGWDALKAGEVVTSSLTFGEGTTYGCDPTLNDAKAEANERFVVVATGFPVDSSALSGTTDEEIYQKAAAVTFNDFDLTTAPDIRPRNTRAGIIIDTGTDLENPVATDIEFGTLRGRLRNNASNAGSPVDELFVELRSGVVVGIVGDDSDSAAESFIGDVTVNIYGGNVTLGDPVVRVLRGCTNYGDVSINIGQRYGVKTKVNWIQSEFSTPSVLVKGNYSFRMSGGQVARYYGAPATTGAILNEMIGGTIGTFDGSRVNQSSDLRNVIKGNAVINGSFYGCRGSASSVKVINEIGENASIKDAFCGVDTGVCESLENRISGGTFYGAYYGAGKSAKCGSVINDVSARPVFENVFYGGAMSGTVSGNITNRISGGIFNGPADNHYCFYGASYSGTMTGSVTNYINDGIFKKYCIAGASIADITASGEYAIKSVIRGGSFSNFWGGSSGSSASVSGDIINEIHGGTFDDYSSNGNTYYSAFTGSCRNAEHIDGNVINTVYGGTFYHNFVPGCVPGSSDYARDCQGRVETRLVGGDFYAKVYNSSTRGTYSQADLILDPDDESKDNKNPLNIYSTVGLEGVSTVENGLEGSTRVILDSSVSQPIYVTSSAQIFADESGNAHIKHLSRWDNGVTYLVMPVGTSSDCVSFSSLDPDGGSVQFVSTSQSVSWIGSNGLLGASLVLTDRIGVKLYFDKGLIDEFISENQTWKFNFENVDGTKKEFVFDALSIAESTDLSTVDSNYVLSLPSVAASEFHSPFTVCGQACGTVSFSIMDLCVNAANEEYAGKTGDFAYLAKSIYNLGIQACRIFHDNDCDEKNLEGFPEVQLADEFLDLSDDSLKINSIGKGDFQFVAAPLVLESGMGIQFYGRYDGTENLSVYVNGTKLGNEFYVLKKIEPTAENGFSNYCFALRIKAAYLHESLVVGVGAGNEKDYSTIVCSIAAACNQYVSGDRDYAVTRALLSYVEAVYHYHNRDAILAERRRLAWEEMYRMMTVIWTPSEDFEYSHNNFYYTSAGEFAGDATKSLRKFKAGTYYSGIPYAHGSASTNAFLAPGTGKPDEKGVYTILPTFEMVTGSPSWARLGNDCNDAVFWAWAASSAHIYNISSAGCVAKNGVIPVGDYDFAYKDDGGQFHMEEGTLVSNPSSIYGKTPYIWLYNEALHGKGTMYEALAQLRPGDGLVYHIVTAVAEDDADETGDAAGHVMMIQDIHVERKADGSVDPDKSYLLLMDQTSSPMGSGTATDPHAKWQKYWDENLGAYVYQCPNVNRDLNGDGIYSPKSSGSYTNTEALHKRTFVNCAPKWNSSKGAYAGGYLPITSVDFEDATPLPVLKITDSLEGTEMDYNSIFQGYLISNYRISHANFSFYDQNGNLVKSFKAFGKEGEFNSNSNHDHLFRFTRLTNEKEALRGIYGTADLSDLNFGQEYTCVVTVQAGTMEDIEVRRFTFTVDHSTQSQ